MELIDILPLHFAWAEVIGAIVFFFFTCVWMKKC